MAYPVMPLGFLGSQGDQDTYKIERSLRFNSADSAYLNRTPASAGNRKTWTWSGWVKRTLRDNVSMFCQYSDVNNQSLVSIRNNTTGTNPNTIRFYDLAGGAFTTEIYWSPVYRDVSAWYHIVFVADTTQSTNTNRIKLYVNGVQVTETISATWPAQNTDLRINLNASHFIGTSGAGADYADGYLTEINFIDGQALTPSSFGETDAITGRWKAKAYAGTYGTNGFYLKFADNSATTATTLGKDSSGNGNNWTPNNFSVTAGADNDSLLDSPTNSGTSGNYCTINQIDRDSRATISNGNLEITYPVYSVSNGAGARSTIGVLTGKWYFESSPSAISTNGNSSLITWTDYLGNLNSSNTIFGGTITKYIGVDADILNNYVKFSTSGYSASLSTGTTLFSSCSSNDIILVAIDFDNGKIWIGKNGIWYNSGNPDNGTNQTSTFTVPSGIKIPYHEAVSSSDNVYRSKITVNFGQRPFAYTAPSGFKALCTTNLPQPIIQKPSSYMDVVTYTGTGAALTPTSSLGFSPDLVWIKGRSGATDHALYDTVRGAEKRLESNNTDAEVTSDGGVTAFNSNGFTLGTLAQVNTNTATYVAWAWDEAPIAGMDIVSYTGNGTNRTIAHNLGVAPKMMIVKLRSLAGQEWSVYHASLANTQFLWLNSTNGVATGSGYWNSTSPTSSVFSIGFGNAVNLNNETYIAYLFAEVEGFSKFGSYTGNGSADGPFVWCGFRPRWVMIKKTTDTLNADWRISDSARSQNNVIEAGLYANLSLAEDTLAHIDYCSNGFKLRTTGNGWNGSGSTYIFAAFAESPFKYARAR